MVSADAYFLWYWSHAMRGTGYIRYLGKLSKALSYRYLMRNVHPPYCSASGFHGLLCTGCMSASRCSLHKVKQMGRSSAPISVGRCTSWETKNPRCLHVAYCLSYYQQRQKLNHQTGPGAEFPEGNMTKSGPSTRTARNVCFTPRSVCVLS